MDEVLDTLMMLCEEEEERLRAQLQAPNRLPPLEEERARGISKKLSEILRLLHKRDIQEDAKDSHRE